jgi:hypothetical protein
MSENKSEVARDLQLIDEQNRAYQRGLTDYRVVGSHEEINARMQQGAALVLQLFRQGRYEDGLLIWEQSADV